jgi:hypothetical protein
MTYVDVKIVIINRKNDSIEMHVTNSDKILNKEHLTPTELNSLTKDLLKLSCKIESFRND